MKSHAQIILNRVSKLFNQEDQTHLGHVCLDLLKEIYPELDAIVHFYLPEHSEFIMHSRQNAQQRFSDNQGLASRVMTQREAFRLDEFEDELDIIPEIDCPGCNEPADIFAVPGYLNDKLSTVLTVYSDEYFAHNFDHSTLHYLAEILAKANKNINEKNSLWNFSESLTSTYASAIEQKSLKNIGFNSNIHAYFNSLIQHINLNQHQIYNIHIAINMQFVGQINIQDNNVLQGLPNYQINVLNKAFAKKIKWPNYLTKVPIILSELQYNFNEQKDKQSIGARILRMLGLFEFVKRSTHLENAISTIKNEAGNSLDPKLVDIFIKKECYQIAKRNSERIDLKFPVEINLLKQLNPKKHHALASNLSETGLKIEIDLSFDLGDLIELTMFLPGQSIIALATIVRVEKTKQKYVYGLHLLYQSQVQEF